VNGILTLAGKDLRLLLRDRAALFWVLGWPLAMGIIFGSMMGGMGARPRGGMAIAVVDQDSTAGSRAFVGRLRTSDALRVWETSLDSARTAVRLGDRVGYVRLKPGFGAGVAFGPGAQSGMEVGMDPSRTAEKGYLQGILMETSFQGLQDQFAQPDSMRRMVRRSVAEVEGAADMQPGQRANVLRFLASLDDYLGHVDTSTYRRGSMGFKGPEIEAVSVERPTNTPRSGFEISFPSAILWALIGCAAGFAQSMVYERTTGTFLRLRTTPLSRAQVLAGKGLACFVASVAVIVLLLALGRGVLGVRLENPAGIALAVLCAALGFTGIMMFISALGSSPRAVAGAGWAILLVMSMTGGGMIPLIAMPPWMRAVSNLSPVKWGVLGLEGAVWRGFSLGEMLLPCAILVGVGAVAFALGVAMSRRWEV
jgi:ABC-2 type transport system permease protein